MKKTLLLILVLLSVVFANAQKTKEQLQKEEAELKKEMNELTNDLASVHGRTKSSLKAMALIQRKKAVVEERVSNINKQVRAIDEDIYHNELEIYRMKKELDTLKTKYAQSIVFAYKNRSSYQYLNFLFSATSFNDAIKRMTYLKSYRQLRETQVDNIVKTQNLLQQQMTTLTGNKKEQSQILVKQKDQLHEAEETRKEQDRIVKDLKNQEKEITAQLRKKEKQRQEMKNAIAAIIKREIAAEAERIRIAKAEAVKREKDRLVADKTGKANEATAKNDGSKPATTTTTKPKANPTNEPVTGLAGGNKEDRVFSPFESTKEGVEISKKFEAKNLPWPVSTGIVTLNFGTFIVPNTHIKGNSDGIEIAVPEGTPVKCVADGVISSIFDIGGELAITVRHGKYFTTYGHLASSSVSKGQEVKSGTQLGKAGTNDDNEGSLLVMVSNDRNVFLNPKNWLSSSRR
jgi:septal ring factor EnvC (AmiA/AmiB activator)